MDTVHLTSKSKNKKTGKIPVSTTSNKTCPVACPFKGNGCYAEAGPLRLFWDKVSDGRAGTDWNTFCDDIEALPEGQLWRHNQAGDLPGKGDSIDALKLKQLVRANTGKRGFTYTHKPMLPLKNLMAVADANRKGFTVNLSANNLEHADHLADFQVAPVVTVLPADVEGNADIRTPKGRKVVVCPATYRDDISCATCQLCSRQASLDEILEGRNERCIVGFPAHGNAKRKAETAAKGFAS